jgi:uncharacterized DUF497 family protein
MRRIEAFLWEDWVVDKLGWKHGLTSEEVEEVFFNPPYKLRRTKGEKYLLYGRSNDGRYLFIVFVWVDHQVKVISARDMVKSERQFYTRK